VRKTRRLSLRKTLCCTASAVALAVAAITGASAMAGAAHAATSTSTSASAARPCNIYAAYGTPCVAAYSTVRTLFRHYHGPLYQVTRASDGAAENIGTQPGGYADAGAQNSFCAGTVCTITRIYDQSPYHNDLGVGPIGGNGGPDAAAIANALPVTIDGHHVYGVSVQAGVGYRNDVTTGVPVGSQPQGAYMVTSGTHVDDLCCFDFGNAETSGTDNGNGHMDAINFSTECWFTPCTGSGPWVQADLENGLFAGGNGASPANKGRSSPFVTAMMDNNGTTTYAILDGNARSGGLATEYNGPLPDIGGYTPMHQEGAIILGTGGDNSNGSDGSFFEGVLTAGYPSAAANQAVQANVVAAGYRQASNGFHPSGTPYTITNVNSGTAAEPAGCGTANGTGIALESSPGNCGQWTFTGAGHGRYIITNVASGRVLDSVDCGNFDGTLTDLWSSLGNLCQEWNVTPAGSHYTISNVANGMVLDAEDCETADGTVVRQWAQLDNTCQQWDLTSASGVTSRRG
jgi:Alpha-L-arabinofuranosidase B, catalytic/Ricin-type beta-trefoil lectin domain-like